MKNLEALGASRQCPRIDRNGRLSAHPRSHPERQTVHLLLGGPRFAKRTTLLGQLTCGGLGKPLGRDEGGPHTDYSDLRLPASRSTAFDRGQCRDAPGGFAPICSHAAWLGVWISPALVYAPS